MIKTKRFLDGIPFGMHFVVLGVILMVYASLGLSLVVGAVGYVVGALLARAYIWWIRGEGLDESK